MVLGTVSATNAASQQLRLDNITTKPLSSFNAFKNALPKSQHREHDQHRVSIMLHNTSATATFNGWRSASFPERSGVQQGSPLSPLLYVIAAQPLASHLRRQSQLGIIRPITMPDGQPAPVSHQHADDTSLHVLFFFFFFFFWEGKIFITRVQ